MPLFIDMGFIHCGVRALKIEIFCPTCAAAGIKRKLMEVDSLTKGIVYPYCKACKKNIKIELNGGGEDTGLQDSIRLYHKSG